MRALSKRPLATPLKIRKPKPVATFDWAVLDRLAEKQLKHYRARSEVKGGFTVEEYATAKGIGAGSASQRILRLEHGGVVQKIGWCHKVLLATDGSRKVCRISVYDVVGK